MKILSYNGYLNGRVWLALAFLVISWANGHASFFGWGRGIGESLPAEPFAAGKGFPNIS